MSMSHLLDPSLPDGAGVIFPAPPEGTTAVLMLADGTCFFGKGFGAVGTQVGELCFHTAMTGYQEVMTDPSYARQLICFTFPHIGNVGVNAEDEEAPELVARGMIIREDITAPSNWRANGRLDDWLKRQNRVGICGVDTRRIARLVRDQGMPHVALAHDPEGIFDLPDLCARAFLWEGIEGVDLARDVSCRQSYRWQETRWSWPGGFKPQEAPRHKVVAVDYGAKRNILRCLAEAGSEVVVLPATATAEEVLAHEPDGVFLSNGPGDPAATGEYAVPMIREVLARDIPVFGICLGHQMLALALGGRTKKMNHGHHGANHPVKDVRSGKVEITSMNHGFTVDAASLPEGVRETHISLFDGTNCGLEMIGKPVFSVQHHPEASPGPQDSFYLFEQFAAAMEARRHLPQYAGD